jgi:hypothetical protein
MFAQTTRTAAAKTRQISTDFVVQALAVVTGAVARVNTAFMPIICRQLS